MAQAKKNGHSYQKVTPKIVERVNKIAVVNMAVTLGFSQYDRLKSSNITVGEVMTRAESWASYLWEKMKPIVDKLQEPINRADKLACQTFDYIEEKLAVKTPTVEANNTAPAPVPIKSK